MTDLKVPTGKASHQPATTITISYGESAVSYTGPAAGRRAVVSARGKAGALSACCREAKPLLLEVDSRRAAA